MLRLCVLLIAAACSAGLYAQGLTGQISGTVHDQAGAVVPQARVDLMNEGTSARRQTAADASGNFVFPELLRGSYTVEVAANGFRKFQKKGITLTATERLVLNDISLEVGELQQVVAVQGEVARVQTQSSERSGLLTTDQIGNLPSRGRDVFDFVKLLPGVVDTAVREAPGGSAINSMNINGGRHGTVNVALDGVGSLDIGSMRGPLIDPAVDSIAEVKVLLNGHQAEYGRSSGATINIITKSGGRDFHGTASYFKKNEALNANDFFNNRGAIKRPVSRYDFPAFTVGGPVLFPGTRFNRARNKVFFFWANDFLPRKSPSALVQRTFPTTPERQGDFSRSFDTNGALIQIVDPLNNRTPFPGNIIPQNRIDKAGQGLLNVFPIPTSFDPKYTYNALVQDTISNPRSQEILRLDLNLSAKTSFFARGIYGVEKNQGPFQTTLGSGSWPQFDVSFLTRKKAISSSLIHIFNSSTVNEFTFGGNYNLSQNGPRNQETLDLNNRVKRGINLPQFNPQINPMNMLPNATFGGISNAATLGIEGRWPYFGAFYTFVWADNFSKIYGRHNFKMGIYIERNINDKAQTAAFNGSFDFSRNANNPLDTNHPYANAVLGVINSYTEADNRQVGHGRFSNVEWYVQDSWKATKRLTLDYGLRFYKIFPVTSLSDQLSYFDGSLYQASQAPKLIQPFLQGTTRVGRNPVTGEIVPAVKIGTFAAGSGTLYQGMRLVNDKILEPPPIQLSPRFGFAYDVFGNGKTALRGSFAMLPDVFRVDMILDQLIQPPLVQTSTSYYTTIAQLLSSPLSKSPNNVNSYQTHYSPAQMYNWSLGVQQNVGFGTVVDVAYLGTRGRHLLQRQSLNALPYGTNFKPSSIDPTVSGNRPLPVDFLRPYQGFADIQYVEFGGSSIYDALQVQVNRRFTSRMQFGVAYTYSKWLTYGISDVDTDVLNPFLDPRVRTYGPAVGDRHHNFVLNYLYNLPRFSKLWSNAFTRRVLDNWNLSGFTTFQTGAPSNISYSFVNAVDITGAAGAGVDSRVDITGPLNLAKGDRSFSHFFNTDAVRAPSAANFGIGNMPKNPLILPGINNWDLQITKRFTFGKTERHQLMIRGELYNAFNHTQFSDVDRAARFDAAGKQTNGRFGEYIAALNGRRVQLAVRYSF